MKALTRYVVVARHGERLDYVSRDSGINWTAQADRPYDPPLTDHGLQQAEKLGKHLAKELERLEIPPISSIYTSPFLRCRQTSLAARKGLVAAQQAKSAAGAAPPPPVRVEYGLSESFNEQWFRSWSLPGADGTWGFRINGNTTIDAETLHPWAKQPVQNLPLFTDWKEDECVVGEDDAATGSGLDLTYEPQTNIPNAYSFHPCNLETREQQCARMKQVVETVSSSSAGMLEPNGDDNQARQQQPTTVLLTSHGAPVTHLYEELTGESWQKHGKSVYCCYSIYKSVVTNDGTATKWEPVVVNESKYLKEILKGDSYITDDPKPTA